MTRKLQVLSYFKEDSFSSLTSALAIHERKFLPSNQAWISDSPKLQIGKNSPKGLICLPDFLNLLGKKWKGWSVWQTHYHWTQKYAGVTLLKKRELLILPSQNSNPKS